MDAARWQRLSPLLDSLLDLAAGERAGRLHRLRTDDPALAAELEALLALDGDDAEPLQPLPGSRSGLRAGACLGPYRLVHPIGEGGMGQVWLAERADGLYQRQLALKLLRPGWSDPNLRARFAREREILARLQHPNIARLLDAGIGEGDQPYLALEYVEGVPITDYCRDHGLAVDARLRLFLQVCAAVSHAHANLIVHRDLKPSNMLVTPGHEVRLLDFGIAKLLDDRGDGEPARTEVRAFTLRYAAPEQIRGEPVSTMTDVYSLGVVLYELLAGEKPYRLRRGSDGEWEQAILDCVPVRPSLAALHQADAGTREPAQARRLSRQLRGDLDNILLRALAKAPAQRYPSVEALALDLQRHLGGRPVQARPPRLGYRLRKYLQRHRWAVALGSLAAVLLLGSLGAALWQAREARHEAARSRALQRFVVGLFDHAGGARQSDGMALRELLSAGARRGESELDDQPRARAELFGVMARLYVGLGDYQEALALARRQELLLEADPQAPQRMRLDAATQHGRILRLLSRSQDCLARMRPLAGEAVRLEDALPQSAADFYVQYGRCRRILGEPQVARQWYERAMAVRRDVLRDDAGVVENLIDLAALDSDAARADAAIEHFLEARQRLHLRLGDRHPLAVQIGRSLGVLYLDVGQAEAAEAALRPALALSTELHGSGHPSTLAVRRQLGLAWLQLGRLAEAGQALQAQHVLTEAMLGPRHRETGLSHDALGRLALERGQTAEAIDQFGRAVAIWRQPDGHHLLDYGLHDLGLALQAAGRDGPAMEALQEARRVRVQRLGADHPAAGDLDRAIGELLLARGQASGALPWLDRAVYLTGHGYGADDPRSLAARLAMARLQGDTAPALERLADALPDETRLRALRWRARAWAARERCDGDTAAQAGAALLALDREVRLALPEGGSVAREVQALAGACGRHG